MKMFLEIAGQMLRTLWAHKMRSFLTMFGIAWGVGSLLLLVGMGEGFRSGQHKELEDIGENIMFLFGGRRPAVEGSLTAMKWFNVTYEDYLAMKREAPLVRNVSPVIDRRDIRAVSEYTSYNGEVFGCLPVYNEIRTVPLAAGRWFNEEDDLQQRDVVVIGDEVRKNLFPGRPSVDEVILLNRYRFQIVGVVEKIGRDGNGGTNTRIFVPLNTMRTLFPLKTGNDYKGIQLGAKSILSFINYQPVSRDQHAAAKFQAQSIVARQHGFKWDGKDNDTFEEWDSIQSEEQVGRIFNAMDWFLGGVGLTTLTLGAIGVVNIMLVSVNERTREIGLRKAIGARNRDILAQFFLEGAFITVVSGLLGLLGAFSLTSILATLPQPTGFDTPRIVPWSAVIAILSLALAGIFAGLYPARKAALLQPVEALRRE